MKSAWNAISIVAVANMLALLGLLGWLYSGDRLNVDRAREIREKLTLTISKEKAEADAKAREEQVKSAAEEAERKASRPPLSAQERLDARLEATELDRQRAIRLRREIEDLQAQLDRQRAEIEAGRADLSQREKAFQAMVQRQREAVESEQFQRALGVLSALKPAEATAILMQIMRSGAGTAPAATPAAQSSPQVAANAPASLAADLAATSQASGMDTVVTYLNAMDDRPRGRIMTELTKADPVLAADLLERVRLLGQFAQVSNAPSGTTP